MRDTLAYFCEYLLALALCLAFVGALALAPICLFAGFLSFAFGDLVGEVVRDVLLCATGICVFLFVTRDALRGVELL